MIDADTLGLWSQYCMVDSEVKHQDSLLLYRPHRRKHLLFKPAGKHCRAHIRVIVSILIRLLSPVQKQTAFKKTRLNRAKTRYDRTMTSPGRQYVQGVVPFKGPDFALRHFLKHPGLILMEAEITSLSVVFDPIQVVIPHGQNVRSLQLVLVMVFPG